jgi:nucleotide-binding universal stress UspA family protein
VPTAAAFAAHLAALGVKAEEHSLAANGETPQAVLSRFYESRCANLLVMGAYSHSRLRQLVLGGFTRHFLRAKSHTLLMVH